MPDALDRRSAREGALVGGARYKQARWVTRAHRHACQ
jgi:hypothetical protein